MVISVSDPDEECRLVWSAAAVCPGFANLPALIPCGHRIWCITIADQPLSPNVSWVSDSKASTVTCTEPMAERVLLIAGELSFFPHTPFLTLLWFLLLSLLPGVSKMSHIPRGSAEGTLHLWANRDWASKASLCLWGVLNTVNKKQQVPNGATHAKSHQDLTVNLIAVSAPLRSGI